MKTSGWELEQRNDQNQSDRNEKEESCNDGC